MELKNEKKPAGIHLRILVIHDRFAVAAEYKIDKEGQHAFVNFRIQHLELAGCTAPLKISTARSLLTKKSVGRQSERDH